MDAIKQAHKKEIDSIKQTKQSIPEAKKKEICEQYFKENHKITNDQACNIFKFIRNICIKNADLNIDSNIDLQQKTVTTLNKILQSK